MSDSRMFQEVFDRLDAVIPDGWDKLVFYAEYDGPSYSMEYYVKTGKTYIKCFDISGLSRSDLLDAFSAIDKIISAERKGLSGSDLWSNMTMVVQSSGKVKVDFGYEDLTEAAYAHKQAWKNKYLV